MCIRDRHFADDIVLIAKNELELKTMANDFKRASCEVELSMNLSKTKIMSNIDNLVSIKLDEEEITKVEEYRYLGQMVSFSDKTNKELKIRRANARKAFWAQRKILLSKMKLSTKM